MDTYFYYLVRVGSLWKLRLNKNGDRWKENTLSDQFRLNSFWWKFQSLSLVANWWTDVLRNRIILVWNQLVVLSPKSPPSSALWRFIPTISWRVDCCCVVRDLQWRSFVSHVSYSQNCGRHEMPPVILSENERTELSNGSQFNVDGTKLKAEARLIVRIRMTIWWMTTRGRWLWLMRQTKKKEMVYHVLKSAMGIHSFVSLSVWPFTHGGQIGDNYIYKLAYILLFVCRRGY